MDINQQKEQFSITYIRAVAAVAGYSLYRPEVDDDSVDLGIAARGYFGRVRSPRLELQLKSSSRDIIDDNVIRYPLKLKNYNDLRMIDFATPRILVVMLMPDDIGDWLQQSQQELCMKHCGYWISLQGMPETINAATVTITIPRTSVFTVTALTSIMQGIGQGVEP